MRVHRPARWLDNDEPLDLWRIEREIVARAETDLEHGAMGGGNFLAAMLAECLGATGAIDHDWQNARFVVVRESAYRC